VHGAGPSDVNLGPPDISETTSTRKLNLNIDAVKYPLWVQKLLYYTIQHEGGRHIDFRQMLLEGQNLSKTNLVDINGQHISIDG